MNSNGKNPVFWISTLVVTFFVVCGAVAPKNFARIAEKVLNFTTNAFGWFYLIAVMFFVVFCFYLAISKYGKIRLGREDERPKYSYFTWIGMLFSAGFGVGLVFWGVAEPMTHFSSPPFGLEVKGGTDEAARTAMRYAFFHWGIHQWSVFTVVGLVMAYFQYKKGRGALISSTITLKNPQKKATWKKTINTLAVIATVMGVATSLGMGILQINGGLAYMYDIPQNATIQLTIVGILLVLYLTSSTSGLDRGIKYLSNLNLGVALVLMLFVLFLGPTVFILETFTLGIGDYIQKFIQMSFYMTPYQQGTWVKDWTIFYWAWVIAWSPFVGSFVSRISRGRTIRELIFGVLLVPPFIAIVWISIFGGTALHMDLFNNIPLTEAVNDDVTSALFATFEHFPLGAILSGLSIFLISVFLVTSADSATFVLGMMTSRGSMNPPLVTKIVWGTLIAAISVVLIISSGLQGLQTASLTAALPFTIIMIIMCVTLFTSIRRDQQAEVKKMERSLVKVASEEMASTEQLESEKTDKVSEL